MPLAVLHADNHVVAVAKPAGVPTVPDESGDASLLDEVREWIRVTAGKPGNVFVGVVHRLDRPVSGVVLFARTSKAASRLSDAWRTRSVEKTYLGLVAGAPPQPSGEVDLWIVKDERRNLVRSVASTHPGAKHGRSRYRVLARRGAVTLLELEPLTGRSHQLRLLCRELGAPLLGDLKYGAGAPLPDASIALHARRLVFPHPIARTPVEIACEPPEVSWWREFRGEWR